MQYNNHWMRYWDLCQPCQVRYDFIGTAENYAKEAELFVHKMDISVRFPEHEAKTTHEGSLGAVKKLMKFPWLKKNSAYGLKS